MIDDQFRNQVAQFVMHMANLRTNKRRGLFDGGDLETNPHWLNSADQRRILESYLDLICSQSIIGVDGEKRLGVDGPPITWQRLRALGVDAAMIAEIAMTGDAPHEGWWFDPRLVDGLTEFYPGKSIKPDQQ